MNLKAKCLTRECMKQIKIKLDWSKIQVGSIALQGHIYKRRNHVLHYSRLKWETKASILHVLEKEHDCKQTKYINVLS